MTDLYEVVRVYKEKATGDSWLSGYGPHAGDRADVQLLDRLWLDVELALMEEAERRRAK